MNKTETISWNTGRQYAVVGQPIAAARLDDGHILFIDGARGIKGRLNNKDASLTRESVMRAYDYREWSDFTSKTPGHKALCVHLYEAIKKVHL